MRRVLLVVFLMLAAGAATAFSVAQVPAGTYADGSPMEEFLLRLLGGSRPATVRVITYAPEPVERIVSWDDLMLQLSRTSFGQAGADNHAPPLGILTGSDEGRGEGGPFCDNSSAWIAYRKEFVVAEVYTRANDLGPAPVVCGGFFGESRVWDVQMSSYPVITAMDSIIDGCYATYWTVHPSGYCPGPGGMDTFGFWNSMGPGVRTSLDYGTVWFEYFLGIGAEVHYGPTPYP